MINYKQFDNGLRLVHQEITHINSVSIGVLVGAGSVYENNKNNGISHFIEHMLFKGTNTKTAQDIVNLIENFGGKINAYTSKETTVYYTVSLSDNVKDCMEVLSDIYFNSTFTQEQMDREKEVVKEEIKMCEDTPDDVCFELLSEIMYEGHPLSRAILGTNESVDGITREDILEYMTNRYCADNTVISVVGNITFEDVIKMVEEYFDANFKNEKSTKIVVKNTKIKPKYSKKIKSIEQSNICIGFNSLPYDHEDEFVLQAMTSILGGSMSSRLFQLIREELGLAYSVYAYPSSYKDNGYIAIYLGTSPAKVDLAINEVGKLCRNFIKEEISDEELMRSKAQLKSAFLMGRESSKSVMLTYGKFLLMTNRLFDFDEKIQQIDSISKEDIFRVANNLLKIEEASISYVGPDTSSNLFEVLLSI
ncbi:MAG: insulinase family protein [Clostridia bacterium]|nr:insulinase family protein [Clostridia bacterium]